MGSARSFLMVVLTLSGVIALGCASDMGGRDKGLRTLPGLTPATVEQAARPRKVALLVGADHFDDSFWPALRFAGRDAEDLATALRDPAVGGFDQVQVLSGPEHTDLASVRNALDALSASAPRPEDTVLVYFSSHGTMSSAPTGMRRLLVLRDTRHDRLDETGLSVGELLGRFESLPSSRKLLVLATCHSGSGKSLLSPETLRALQGVKGSAPSIEQISRASLVFSAAQFGQAAREDDRLGHDVYTYYLLEALALRADANGDGAISATEAHDYARRQTYAFTSGRQVPTVQSTVVGADPVILAGAVQRAGLPVVYSYASGLDGAELRQDGRNKGSLPGNVVLSSGDHEISLWKGGQQIYSRRVRLDRGQRLDMEEIIQRDQPRVSVGLRGSAFALLDPGLSGQVVAPLAGASLSLRLRDLPWPHLDPLVDLSLSRGEQTVRPGTFDVRQQVSAVRLGVGAAAAIDLWKLRLYGGPHLSFLYLDRQLVLDSPSAKQSFGSLMPGAVAGLALQLSFIEIQLETQLHYLPLMLDGEIASVATGSVAAGLGWRF